MNDYLRRVKMWFTGFAKPKFDLGNDDKLHQADELHQELKEREQALERRLKLLEIQGTPRGPLNG